MAETKEKKGFKAGAYSVIATVLIGVVLVLLTIFAFTTRYTAFSPEKVATSFTDTIVQTGDGYNAYKNTLVSKGDKYGDFIRKAYMAPFVNDGENVKQADFVGTGTEEEATAIDTVYNTMYDYFVQLINTYGFDNYDAVFSNYFQKLAEVRNTVYGDDYMDTEFMFGAFETNVTTYGESLAGVEEQKAADGKTVLRKASKGVYQNQFGDNYKFTAKVTDTKELSEDEVKEYVAAYKERIAPLAASGEAKADKFGLKDTDKKNTPKSTMIDAFAKLDCSEEIGAVDVCTVDVTLEDGSKVASIQVYVVQIGNSWYVDETNTDTSALYLAK